MWTSLEEIFLPPATVFLGILNTKMKFLSCICKSHMFNGTLPVLQYACSAVRFTKSQLNDLNVCWTSVYRRIFGLFKFEPVHCFIAGLRRLDFQHIHLLLTLKLIKCAQFTSNTVFKSLVGIHTQSSAFSLLLKSGNLSKDDFMKLPVYALKGIIIIDLFRLGMTCSRVLVS